MFMAEQVSMSQTWRTCLSFESTPLRGLKRKDSQSIAIKVRGVASRTNNKNGNRQATRLEEIILSSKVERIFTRRLTRSHPFSVLHFSFYCDSQFRRQPLSNQITAFSGNNAAFVLRFPLRKFCDLKETALEGNIFTSATGKVVMKA
jgi:hypothetical protein